MILFTGTLAGHVHLDVSNLSVLAYVVIGICTVAALWSIWRAVGLTLRPGETEADHIKRWILTEPAALEIGVSSVSVPAAGARESGPARRGSDE